MANASIRPCTCTHAQQDAIHGRGMRVHNPTRKLSGMRCTVCRKETGNDKKETK